MIQIKDTTYHHISFYNNVENEILVSFEVKLIKRPPARWITETIKNEINKKYILSHEYKSIVDDEANCRRKQITNNKK